MSKHILLYTDDPGIYGVGQYNHTILCELKNLGYRISCVQAKRENLLINHREELGIQHFWLESEDFSNSLTNPEQTQRILSTANPDLIIFSDCCPVSNFAAKRVATRLAIPYIIIEGFVAPYLAERFGEYLTELSLYYSKAKTVIAVSNENINLLHTLFKLPNNKGIVIHYGRPSEYFTSPNLSVRDRLRQELTIPASAVVCFTAARLELVKGFRYQLEAIKLLKQSRVWSQLYFVWAGTGSLETELKAELAQLEVTDKVKLVGERTDIADLLDASDIFLLPSTVEGMPLAIMEAMAKGLPVIASAVSGIPEELGNTGKLLPDPKIDPQATVTELVSTLAAWCDDTQLRNTIGLACKVRAEAMFRQERMVKETLEAIEQAFKIVSVEPSENIKTLGFNRLIQPEIKNDELYDAIKEIAKTESIKTILEIGSSSGEGSTEAFVTGLRENPHRPSLFCMEVSRARFAELQKKYINDDFVKCYNVSSVALEKFPKQEEIVRFYKSNDTNLRFFPLNQILGWLKADIEYVQRSGVEQRGIEQIKQENKIDFFDVVLIDGSEFTGEAELDDIYGAKYILLDDIITFKNYQNFYRLLNDDNYSLVKQNQHLRNGYAIFKKISVQAVNLRQRQILFSVGVARLEADFKRFTSPRFREYANHHGFEYQEITQYDAVSERQPHWIKIHYALKLFQELSPGDLIVFLDADIAIVRGDLELKTYKSIAFAKDSSGLINSGVWAVRVNEFSKRFFEAVWNRTDCDEHPWQDNLAVMKVIDELSPEEQEKHIEILPNCLNVTLVKGEYPLYDIHLKQPPSEPIRFRHFAGRQPWLGKYFSQAIDFNPSGLEPSLSELPIHFFTIVINGEPFIRYHIEAFKQLPFKWHWHIIEGIADLKHDTSWSLRLGGRIPNELHKNGLSIDGTTEYLDELAKIYPNYVTVYRKPEGVFWDGKLEMVNTPLANIQEQCLLWQVDVDELWTPEQISEGRNMFIEHPEKTAAFYWCWYFVGENLVISTRNCYSATPGIEWRRTWKYQPGYFWAKHEPPLLVDPLLDEESNVISDINPFWHNETESRGLVFQHFSYVLEKQAVFKEQYYGFKDAVAQWKSLQKETKFPTLLRQYFSWVHDEAVVDRAESCGIVPITQRDAKGWWFLSSEEWQRRTLEVEKLDPRIIVDGVFFQLYKTGIARVWSELLTEWVKIGFSKHIIVLDRDETAPEIPGIRRVLIPPYDYDKTDKDREMLQQICDAIGADLFISTYYTTPISTPSAFMAYDMVPEAIRADLNQPMWQEKHYGIRHASAYIAISENTAQDLVKFFPDISRESIVVAPCGVDSSFSPADPKEVELFKMQYGISKPYFLLVGGRKGNKNAIFFFRAFSKLYSKQGFEIVCVGGDPQLEAEFRAYTPGNVVHVLQLSDEELRFAYSGAVALIYPSKYEGFGLPVLEAMACGCPVITCANASIPEVAGDAAIYVDDSNENELADALCEVQKPDIRELLSEAGLEQAKQFSWSKMAKMVSIALLETSIAEIEKSLLHLKLNEINLIIFPDWSAPEELLYSDIASAIKAVVTHPDKARITLLIDTSNISDEDADMAVSSVAMDLLMEEELGESEGVEISLVGDLRRSQWDALLRRVQVRISLEQENELAIAQAKAQDLPCLTTYSLCDRRAVQLESGTWIFE
jgi:glycosyltransferase involved in cell wall biosynthesis